MPGKIRRAVEVLPPKGCVRIATAMNLCLKSTFDYRYGQSIALRIARTPFQVEKLPAHVDLLHVVARMNILTPRGRTWDEKIRALSVPMFFRLLYSSGLRTCEARLLRRKDIDLSTGVVSVRHSKGPNEHFVVLHDTMLTLMAQYDTAVDVLAPGREYFFSSRRNGHHTRKWVGNNFREIWDGCGFPYATAFDLRHCYATTNINKWIENDGEFNSRFVYLSKSMGHSVLESTRYYYSLTPAFSDVMLDLCSVSFDAIVPEVEDAEKL